MSLPVRYWQRTIRLLGFKVDPDSVLRSGGADRTRRRASNLEQSIAYNLLEPRHLLAGDVVIQVVDPLADRAFLHEQGGASVDSFPIQPSRNVRGTATSPDGSTFYLIDANKRVSVFDAQTQTHLGTWRAGDVSSVQGIGTDGTNIWIVDQARDRIYFFQDAAQQRSGFARADESIRLAFQNRKPTGISTDGELIWVVDDRDHVFVYRVDGTKLGNWRLDFRNRDPKGVAIDPAGGDGLWVVDGKDDRVYFYEHGRDFRWGYHGADQMFGLGSGNRKPEGIAIRAGTAEPIPKIPLIEAITEDRGVSNIDGLTNDSQLIVSGQADAGTLVSLFESSMGWLGEATADAAGNWSIDATSTDLPDGQYTLTATATNGSGTSDPSLPFIVSIDTAATVNLAILRIQQDTGDDASDLITHDNTILVSGVTEPGVMVTLFEQTVGPVGTGISDPMGNWSIDLAPWVLPDGSHVFNATATDAAGNVSSPSAPLTVFIDTAAPSAPVITRISEDTGIDPSDGVTRQAYQVIEGTAEPNVRVVLKDLDSEFQGVAVADSSGNWSFETTWQESSYRLFATSIDPAGNPSDSSVTFDFEVDLTIPVVPTIADISVDSAVPGDRVTNDNTLVIHGAAEPGSTNYLMESTIGFLGAVVADAEGSWTLDLTGTPLNDGVFRFSANSEDVAGNISAQSPAFEVTLDTLDPDVPSLARIDEDTGQSISDQVTHDNTLVFSGLGTAGVWIRVVEPAMGMIGETLADESGAWMLDASNWIFPDGSYSFFATARDLAGNTSANSAALMVEIDTVAPDSATILGIESDTGSIPNDGITNDDTLSFQGSAEPGSTVRIVESMIGDVGSTVTDAAGQWQIDATHVVLADGSYLFVAHSEDLAGNEAPASPGFHVVVDKLAPDAPSILRAIDDTGASDSDGVTRDETLVFSGMAEPNSQVSLFESTLGWMGSVDVDGFGHWEFDSSANPFSDGHYSFVAMAEDAAGNQSIISEPYDVEVDSVAPLAAAILSIDEDTGVVSDDGITQDNTLVFHGVAEPDSEVALFETVFGLLKTAVTNGSGTWQVDLTDVPLADGSYGFTVVATDAAGNSGIGSALYSVVIDRQVPEIPAIIQVIDDTGSYPVDGVTRDNTLVLVGMGAPNTRVSVFEDSLGLVGSTLADGSGFWSLDATSLTLADATYYFTAVGEDAAGNRSPDSNAFSVTVDTVAPDPAVLTSIENDSGLVIDDGVTNDSTLKINGLAESNSHVELYLLGVGVLATTVTDAEGSWQFDLTDTPLADGVYQFAVTASDLAGNVGAPSLPLDVVVDTIAPPDLSIFRIDEDHGTSDVDRVTNDPTLVLAGVAEPAAVVHVSEQRLGLIGTAVVDQGGMWSIDATGYLLGDGIYEFSAIAVDLAGNMSASTSAWSVTIDTTVPSQPVIISIENDSGFDSNDGVTNDNTLIFHGVAEPFSQISVADSVAGLLGITTGDESGAWTLDTGSFDLTDGLHGITATSSDLAGNSSLSENYSLLIDTANPVPPSIVTIVDDNGHSSDDGITNDASLSLIGFAESGSVVTVEATGLGTFGSGATDINGVWTVMLPELSDGQYAFTSTATDAAGNVSANSDAFGVVVDTFAPQSPMFDLDPSFDSLPIGDHSTDLPIVALQGTTEPGATVKLALGLGPVGGVIAESVADASGRFRFADVELDPGENQFSVLATDVAGNESMYSQAINLNQVDNDPPEIYIGLLNDTGLDSNDAITTDPALVGSVSDASPIQFVDFYFYSDVLGTEFYLEITSELVNGQFELDRTFLESLVGGPLPLGEYYYCLEAEDIYGNFDFVDGEFLLVDTDVGDVLPPIVSFELLNDTGPDPNDRRTDDASLTGSVIDQSPVMLTLLIGDFGDLESGNNHPIDVTDLIQQDGTFIIPQSRLEAALGHALENETYYLTLEATDQVNVGSSSLSFEYIVLAAPPTITAIANDTGRSSTDGVTSDESLTILGVAEPESEIEIHESVLGQLGTTTSEPDGSWSFAIPQPGLADGDYRFTAFAISSGLPSGASNVFSVTIDTELPLRTKFDLDLASDTGTKGDSYTTNEWVTLTGTAFPNAELRLKGTSLSTIADVDGHFSLSDVQLDLGRRYYELIAEDLAGNQSVSRKSIAFDQPFTVSESGFVTEVTRTVELGQPAGTRTVSFRIESADFASAPGFQDTLAVYLVDPADPSRTLIDRGLPGTSLFTLSGERADYLPGLVRYDGSRVEIDVSSIRESIQGELLFQLINQDGGISSSVSIVELGSILDVAGMPVPYSSARTASEPGAALQTSSLSPSTGLVLQQENARYDSSTSRYQVDLRIRNDGPDVGRMIAATFDGLSPDTVLLNGSGVDTQGFPYVSFRDAVPAHGLLTGQVSEAIRLEFAAPANSPFINAPTVSDGGANAAPVLSPIDSIVMFPGDVVRVDLNASDVDGDHYFTMGEVSDLPNTTLTANGQLVFTPSPDQIGSYEFEVVVSDGMLTDSQTVQVNVVPDPITTTRISGFVLDTNSAPLAGIPVELGGVSTDTAADGAFELEYAGPLPGDTLIVHGESFAGPEVYPFIAEKLPLLYGHDAYANVNNFIERPIYLPALDVATGVAIDPANDITVTTSTIPLASVFVAAGTLETQGGGAFTGNLSITEVPPDFTPAALPADVFPDMVVTIQPGEMVFTSPAPLNLPNLAGYVPGTEMTLWSINPNTGLFDNVGVGVVNPSGDAVETVSGGINNSSWHFFAPAGPTLTPPESNPRNQDKQCADCELTHSPNEHPGPDEGDSTGNDDQPLDLGFLDALREPFINANPANPSPSGIRTGGFDGGWGSGGSMLMNDSGDFGPYGSWGGSQGTIHSLAGLGPSSNVTPSNQPLVSDDRLNDDTTEIALHSGAVYKHHALVPYQSLNRWQGLVLSYDSERADARPIVSTGFNNIQNNLPDPTLATRLTMVRGSLRMEVPGFVGTQSGLTGGEHFFQFPEDATSLDVSIQADMRQMPTGVYQYESLNRFAGDAAGSFTGTASIARDSIVHVNTIQSPLGAGWGISGLLELVENPDGSVLLVNGNGGELLFSAPPIAGEPYVSPAGDFSILVRLPDGRFQRTHVDQTVETYDSNDQLARSVDRNGNVTAFQYDNEGNIEFIIDPVGLTTTFRYLNGRVAEIEDPAGRITRLTYDQGNLISVQDPDLTQRAFEYDAMNRLVGETDKLGRTESIQYGFSGRVESLTRADASVISYTPVQTQGLSRSELTSRPESQVQASTLGPDASAQVADANGNVTEYELDQQGQMLGASDGDGPLPEIERNQENLIERAADARGNLTTIEYDERGNVISVSDVVARGAHTDPAFSDPIYPVVPWTHEFVAADINGDGFVDIISESGTLGDSVAVQLGDGAGGFDIGVAFHVENPESLFAVDVDRDGNLDVVTSNSGNQVSVLLGNGDGTLRPAVGFDSGEGPQMIRSADFNNDGFIDLVTADHEGDSVSILLGDGSGQFNSYSSLSVADAPHAIAIGDINDDFTPDIVVAHSGSENGISVLIGDGAGAFETGLFVSMDVGTEFVLLDDFTGDGELDIVTGDSDILLLSGRGDATFSPAEATPTGSTPGSFHTVNAIKSDTDRDGDLDLIFVDTSVDAIQVFENDGRGQFVSTQTLVSDVGPISAADVNFDGVQDIVSLSGGIVSFRGNGDGTFNEPPPRSTRSIPVGDGPTSVAAADFNNDGHHDVAVVSQLDSSITVMLGDGNGELTGLNPIFSAGSLISIQTADLDDDGNFDLVAANYDADSIEIYYGNGLGEFSLPVVISFPTEGPIDVKVGDFNNDSIPDLVAVGHRGSSASGFSVALGNGNRTFESSPLIPATFEAGSIDIGDVNGDGNQDVVVGVAYFSNGNAAQPFFGVGDGSFVDQGRIPFGGGSFTGSPKQLKLIDLDGDLVLDIVGVDETQNVIRVLKGIGNGTFGAALTYAVDASPRAFDVGDVNRDGWLDVIVTNFDSDRVSVWYGMAGGGLDGRRDFAVGRGPLGIKLVDLDDDGALDFVSSDLVADAISVRINSLDLFNQAAKTYQYNSQFNQLTQSVDELERQVLYEIDPGNGNTISMTEVVGELGGADDVVTTYSYTARGLLGSMVDPLGRVTEFRYNGRGLLESTTFAVGTTVESEVSYEYDAAGNQTAMIDELGHRFEFVYDALNRVIDMIEPDPDGSGPLLAPMTTNTYDSQGNLVLGTDALNNTTQFVYDPLDRLIESIDAYQNSIRHEYDQAGNLIATTDRLGRRTEFGYDRRNRLIETTDAEGGRARRAYDLDNNVTGWIDENGVATARVFDARNRLVRTTDGLGGAVGYEFDRVNNLVGTTDEIGRRITTSHDELNRVVATTLPDPDQSGAAGAPVTLYEYDAASNVVKTTDALGNSTSYDYDERDRLIRISESDPDGFGPLSSPIWSHVYDAANRLVRTIDPLLRETEFSYDHLNRRVAEKFPDPDGTGPETSPVMAYAYDAAGNRRSITDALGNTTTFGYDDLHRLIEITEPDPDGPGPLLSPNTTIQLDAEGQVESRIDPLGRATAFEYDLVGRVITEIQPDPGGEAAGSSPVFRYEFDGVGNPIATIDALGNRTKYIYDDNDRLVLIVQPDPDGSAGAAESPLSVMKYDPAHQLVSSSDPLRRTTTYRYDQLGRLIQETLPDPDGAGPESAPTTRYTFDLMNNELSMTDALGNTTAYEYDNLYRMSKMIEADPDGAGPSTQPISSFSYDAANQLTTSTDALGRVTQMVYDRLGRLIELAEPDPDGTGPSSAPVTSFAYDAMGNQRSETDALGNQTQFVYDNLHRRTTIIQADPDGSGPQTHPTFTLQYDAASQVTATTDPLGRTTLFMFDDLGRVVQVDDPDPDGLGPLLAPRTTSSYDLMGNLVSMTDAVGNVTDYEFDNLHRMTHLIEPDPDHAGPLTRSVTLFSYDLASQLLSTTDAENRTTINQYDALGRLIRVIQPDPDGGGPLLAPETKHTYDLLNHPISTIDSLGQESSWEYDHLYRVVRETGADLDGAGPLDSPVTEFAYDLVGNLLSLTDNHGNITQYSYDELDRVFEESIELTPGNFQTRRYAYDLEDHLTRQTDRNGRTIELEYDAIYRIIRENWLDVTDVTVNSIDSAFDESSQLLSVEDLANGSRYDYSYDDLGRVTQTDSSNGGPSVSYSSTYDALSRRTQYAASVAGVADFQEVFTYDARSRLTGIEQTAQLGGAAVADKRAALEYNADNQLASLVRYDEPVGIGVDHVLKSTFSYDGIGRLNALNYENASAAIVDYQWVLDAGGRVTHVANSIDGASEFEYDRTNQLTSVVHDSRDDESYSYDEDGNRTNSGYVTGNYNRLESDGIFDYEYDAEGNRIRRTRITTGAVTEYRWDHRNRLVEVIDRASVGGAAVQSVQHRYDAYNRWISRSVDQDGEGAGPPSTTYYEYDGSRMVLAMDEAGSVTNRYFWLPGVDQLLADEQVNDQVYWVATDRMGTVGDVVDSNGNLVNHIVYDSFGNITSETDPAVDILFGFTGRPFDASTGLQNNLNRWYDAAVGRWLSEDPIAFQAGDANLYRYVGNNSLNSLDPDGLDEFWARSKRGFDRMGNMIAAAGQSLANRAKSTLQQSSIGRFGLELGETTLDVGGTVGKAALVDPLPYLYEDVAPAAGELLAIQAARVSGNAGLAESIRRNSRYSQTRDIENYIATHGRDKTRAMLEEALVYADIAAHVYGGERGETVEGFELVRKFEDRIWGNSGFQAALYTNPQSGKHILAFAGTNPALTGLDGRRDLCQDIKQGFGRKTEQYELAIQLAGKVKKRYGTNITLAGHSLGGGLTTAAALVHNLPGFVVDPAGVHAKTIGRHGADFSRVDELIKGVRLHGEVLTTYVNTAPGAAPTRGNIVTIPASGFVDPLTGHSSSLVANYIRDLLGRERPAE